MLCMVSFYLLSDAQIKRTYTDNVYSQTTVAVKEDGASDVEVLNEAFDLDEFGMDQQIRITTEQFQALQAADQTNNASTSSEAPQQTITQAPKEAKIVAITSFPRPSNNTSVASNQRIQRPAMRGPSLRKNTSSKRTQTKKTATPTLDKPQAQPQARTVEQSRSRRTSSGLYPVKKHSLPKGKKVKLKKRKKRFKKRRFLSCYSF